MKGESGYLSVMRALAMVSSKVAVRPRLEEVHSAEALDRVLARTVVAPSDVPPADRSHMDGFAARVGDVNSKAGKQVSLKVVGRVELGVESQFPLGRGEAAAVSTGSILPNGADVVLPSEDVERRGEEILVTGVLRRWQHVHRRGRDVAKGERLLVRGNFLRPQDLALLLSIGQERITVYRRPKVALLATGSELTDRDGSKLGVRNTHGVLFGGLLKQLGFLPVDLGAVRDQVEEIASALNSALDGADAVLLRGGSSVGERDVTEQAVLRLGPEVLVHGVRMDRGRVSGVAVVKGKLVVMMPGPAQAALNAFLLLAQPQLAKLVGRKALLASIPAILMKKWEAREQFAHFTKVLYLKVDTSKSPGRAFPVTGETDSVPMLAKANAYTIVPEAVISVEKGRTVNAVLLPGLHI